MAKRSLTIEQSDRLSAHIPPWLAGILGLVASCLGLLSVIGFLYLMLAATGLFQLLGEWARRSVEDEAAYGMGLWQSLGAILLSSTLNILASLWSARWGFVVFGTLGCLAGLVTRRILRTNARLGGWGSFLFFFLSSLYLIVPGSFYIVSGSEALFSMAGTAPEKALFSSFLTELIGGVFFALVIAVFAWEMWRLSYTTLLSWAVTLSPSLQRGYYETSAHRYVPRSVMEDWRTYNTRLRELKRDEQALEQARWRRPKSGQDSPTDLEPLVTQDSPPPTASPPVEEEQSLVDQLVRPFTLAVLPAILVCSLSVLGIRALRPPFLNRRAHTVENWVAVVSPDRPQRIFPVEIVYRPQTLTIIKLTGGGVVTIFITGPEPSEEEVWSLKSWDLTEHPFTREYSIAHLSPGLYQITFQLDGKDRNGDEEAGLGYTYFQGGGPVAQRLGLVSGLLIATAFVAAGIVLVAGILNLFLIVARSRTLGL